MYMKRVLYAVFFLLLVSGWGAAAGSGLPQPPSRPDTPGGLSAAADSAGPSDQSSERSLSFEEETREVPQEGQLGETQSVRDSQDTRGGGVVIYIFLGMFLLGILGLVIYLKCCIRQPTRAQAPQKDYKIMMFDGSKEQVDIKMRLNDVSTGSPDIPGWDQEKDVVKAEKFIGAV